MVGCQRLLILGITRDCRDWTSIHNALHLAQQSNQTFVVGSLLSEQCLKYLSSRTNTTLPNTSVVRAIWGIEGPLDISLQEVFVDFLLIPGVDGFTELFLTA